MRYFAYKNSNFLGGRPPNPLLHLRKWNNLENYNITPSVRTLDLGPNTPLIFDTIWPKIVLYTDKMADTGHNYTKDHKYQSK